QQRAPRARGLEERVHHVVDVGHRRVVDGERMRPPEVDPQPAIALPDPVQDREHDEEEGCLFEAPGDPVDSRSPVLPDRYRRHLAIVYQLGSRAAMGLNPGRTVEELRELQEVTGDENGAQRVAWTDTWEQARDWLRGRLEGVPVEEEVDEAGNQWFTLPGGSERALLIGGHIDSVPNGGWLDGALNVMAGVEVLRRIAEEGQPPVTVRLVNWADEEGARFGRSLFGS